MDNLKKWNVINSEGEVIRQVVAGNRSAAAGKVRFLYRNLACFLKIKRA